MVNVQDSGKYMKFFKNEMLKSKMYSLQASSYITHKYSNML